MTTIDYKEKYEAALERCKKLYNEAKANEYTSDIEDYETIFPELKESEDERIRNEIIDFATKANNGATSILANNYNFNKWLAWLEKQGEQKPAEWSEEDEEYLNFVIATIKTLQVKCSENEIKRHSSSQFAPYYGKIINWLKSLKDRVQPKQEWSESDKDRIEELVALIRHSNYTDGVKRKVISWLDSLKDKVRLQLLPQQECSEEDKKKLNRIYTLLAEAADTHAFSTTCRLIGDKECVELQDFLRSLRPQPKQEWSEEDEDNYKRILEILQDCHAYGRYDLRMDEHAALKNWLKSLKGRV